MSEGIYITMDEYRALQALIFDDQGNFIRNIVGVRTAPLANWYEIRFYEKKDADAFKALRDELRVSSR